MLFVHHPDDDKALLVARSQLLVLIVPLDDHNVALMTLEVLIHGEVTATVALARLKLEDLENALVSTSGQIALLLVPAHGVKHGAVRH